MINSFRTLLSVLIGIGSLLLTEVNEKIHFNFKTDTKSDSDETGAENPKKEISIANNQIVRGIYFTEENERNETQSEKKISYDESDNSVTLTGYNIVKLYSMKTEEFEEDEIKGKNLHQIYLNVKKNHKDWKFYEKDNTVKLKSNKLLNEIKDPEKINSRNFKALISFSSEWGKEDNPDKIADEFQKFSTKEFEVPIMVTKDESGVKNIEVEISGENIENIVHGWLPKNSNMTFKELFDQAGTLNEEDKKKETFFIKTENGLIRVENKDLNFDLNFQEAEQQNQRLGEGDQQLDESSQRADTPSKNLSSETESRAHQYPSAINTTSGDKTDNNKINPVSKFNKPEDINNLSNPDNQKKKTSDADEDDEKDGFKMPAWGWVLIAIFVFAIVFFIMKFIFSENPDEE